MKALIEFKFIILSGKECHSSVDEKKYVLYNSVHERSTVFVYRKVDVYGTGLVQKLVQEICYLHAQVKDF